MKYCEHCGGKLEGDNTYCPNCGASVTKDDKVLHEGEVVNNEVNSQTSYQAVKDNTTVAFVCSLIGALCCTYVAIPGLILSIQSLQQIKEGKISSDKKWMAIAGIVLSSIGLIQMVWNFTHLQENTNRIQDVINQFNENVNK